MRRRLVPNLFAAVVLLASALVPAELAAIRYDRHELYGIDPQVIAETLSPYAQRNEFPTQLTLQTGSRQHRVDVHYSFDPGLQELLHELYTRYKPDYGTFVAMDAETGAIIAMMSYVKDGSNLGNLALRSEYPAASVFKIVTAAAACDRGELNPNSIVPYNGRRSTLYKRQVLRHKDGKWTRRPTLRTAFAESINSVFGRIGVFDLGAPVLSDYAERFGFNRELASDLEIPVSTATIDDDPWQVAEAASGYTRLNTMSPIHGAMIASAVINDGHMRVPYVVSKMTGAHGVLVYAVEPRSTPVFQASAAGQMRQLMQETVRRGSARNAFKKFFQGALKDIEVGGKTGSLTGTSPKGRHDWFVGYARLDERKITFAALTINKKYWTVKSSFLARKVIEAYFKEPAREATVANGNT